MVSTKMRITALKALNAISKQQMSIRDLAKATHLSYRMKWP